MISYVLQFLLLYFLFSLIQYVVALMGTIFDVLNALLGVKLVEYQSRFDTSDDSKEVNCIGFQIPSVEEEEEYE